ncbi:hypothetical protein Skr01_47370 [Sphaerisporangium krabiense]|uniref:Uncharacterized protein n=1 Tax=Sphaerisporangium krabiense TaxID=763782 RepID=A0A7W8Z1P7_9ACTN|nr:hypothetical protein [Sphaerisporangium krabiense]GII64652.1 hypothetical protein Skr01_47370 [Sphaerisporangium krabiense]
MNRPARSTSPLLTVRAALIFGLSLIFGAAAGALTYWATRSAAGAFLGTGAATGGTIGLLNQIISDTTIDNGD